MVSIYKYICFVLFVIQTVVGLSASTYISRGDMDEFSSDIGLLIESDVIQCNISAGYCKCARFATFVYYKESNEGKCVKNYLYMQHCNRFSGSKGIQIVPSGSESPVNFTFNTLNRHVKCHWQSTQYTEDGVNYATWPYPESNPGNISVQQESDNDPRTLMISNPNVLLSMYPGILLKLNIRCPIGRSYYIICLLLKIEGQRNFRINADILSVSHTPSTIPTKSSTSSSIPSLTSSSTSSMTSSPTTQISDMPVTPQTKSLNTSPSLITTKLSTSLSSTTTISPDPENDERESDENKSNDLVFILVPTLLVFVLVVMLVGLLIRKRRSKSISRNIDGSDDDYNTLPHHATLTKKPQDASQAYAVPGSQIDTTPVYDNVPENGLKQEYDYATCDAPATRISNTTSPQSIYQDVDNLDGVPESNVKREDKLGHIDESKENPYYHSLEEVSKENIYDEAQTNEPFYNVLEKPN